MHPWITRTSTTNTSALTYNWSKLHSLQTYFRNHTTHNICIYVYRYTFTDRAISSILHSLAWAKRSRNSLPMCPQRRARKSFAHNINCMVYSWRRFRLLRCLLQWQMMLLLISAEAGWVRYAGCQAGYWRSLRCHRCIPAPVIAKI